MTLYIAKNVNYNDLSKYAKNSKIEKENGEYLIIINKYSITPKAFERLGNLLFRLGYTYNRDYLSVEVFKNSIERNIGDIIGEKGSITNPIPEIYHTYNSDIDFGDIFNNMIVKII